MSDTADEFGWDEPGSENDSTTEHDSTTDDSGGRASRFWRTVWRLHFYAGMLSMPFIVLLAVTGLIILYTDPVYRLTEGDLRVIETGEQTVPVADQLELATGAISTDHYLSAIVTPKHDDEAMVFTFTTDDVTYTNVYVDQYRGEVLGTGANDYGTGLVGLANRLHGYLNNNHNWKLWGVSIGGVLNDGEPILTKEPTVPVSEVFLEVVAVWALVLALSGIYLWWPRKKHTGKALFIPRLAKRGRARWRDLHAIPGILMSLVLVFFVATGLAWADLWGSSFWYPINQELAPAAEAAEPSSLPVTVGDLDVFGNRIPWVSQGEPIPASDGEPHHGDDESEPSDASDAGDTSDPNASGDATTRPRQLGLDAVMQLADDDGLLRGYSIALPVDGEDENGNPVYGTYVVTDPWPAKTTTERVVFFDQFSGQKLGESTPKDWGRLAQITEWGVQTHMGTQLGVFSRIVMTFGCVAIIWSAFTGLVMWWKRRPQGRVGLPRRPTTARLPKGLIAIGVIVGLLYPLWALSAILVLVIDRFVIRRIAPLRRAFGMR